MTTASFSGFLFKGLEIPEHSLVVREEIGSANADTLMCFSGHATCCTDTENTWRFASTASPGTNPTTDFYQSRGEGVVRLHHGGSATGEGIFYCNIRVSDSSIQTLYVGIYPSVSDGGGDGTVTVDCTVGTFTLTSGPEANPPEFTLSGCTSSGGAVKEFSCTNPGGEITGTTDGVVSFTARSRLEGNYAFSVSVTGNYPGEYTCQATVYRYNGTDDEPEILLYPATPGPAQTITVPGPSILPVSAADIPTNVSASRLGTTLQVNWIPPSPTPYGYKIYYQPEGGSQQSVIVVNGRKNSHVLAVQDVVYTVSMQSLSETTLPSVETQEVTSIVDFIVTTSVIGGTPALGQSLDLLCSVYMPTSETLTIEWITPSDDVIATVARGSDTTLLLNLLYLRLSDSGVYTCRANSSEVVRENTEVVVLQVFPDVSVSHNGYGTLYAGSVLALECAAILPPITSTILDDLAVDIVWRDSQSRLMTDGRVTVGDVQVFIFGTIQFTSLLVEFNTLRTSDTGTYTCTATVTYTGPLDLSGEETSDSFDIAVVTPPFVVTVEANTTRLPDVPPYNTFTILCTASAPAGVITAKAIQWRRRIGSSTTGLDIVTDNTDTILIDTRDLTRAVSTSLLTVTADTAGDYRYSCLVDVPEIELITVTEDVYPIDVIGPAAPSFTDLTATIVEFDRATIQWAVATIAYTPEIYVLNYGTDMSMLDSVSETISTGSDFEAANLQFQVVLFGLDFTTDYYFQLVANNTLMSTSSDVMSFTTLERTPDPPMNFVVNVVSTDALQFSWDPPNFKYGVPSVYKLSCEITFPPELGEKLYREYLLSDSNRTMSIMESLWGVSPGVSYHCSVFSSNTAGDGRPTVQSVTTEETFPTGPPQLFQIISANVTGLTFSWSAIAPELRNGNITSYTLICDPTVEFILPVTTEEMTISLCGFTPNTTYTCQVFGSNSAGDSPTSSGTVQTPEQDCGTADTCSQNAMCTSVETGFVCECHAGYTGNGVNCGCNYGELRLVNGTNASTEVSMTGRVEVCINNTYIAVCDDQWDELGARVVCKQLGFSSRDALPLKGLAGASHSETGTHLGIVVCSGEEVSLLDCYSKFQTLRNCDHAGVTCKASCHEGEVRLNTSSVVVVNPNVEQYINGNLSVGRVEICVNGRFGTICDDTWNEQNAAVVCRQLSFSPYGAIALKGVYLEGTLPSVINGLSCVGTESSLIECNLDQPRSSCGFFEDAGVVCQDPSTDPGNCTTGDVRIIGVEKEPEGTKEGRVEVCVNNAWGTVCGDDNFGLPEARVICHKLEGFQKDGAEILLDGEPGMGPIFFQRLDCFGDESTPLECNTETGSHGLHQCTHEMDAHIRCVDTNECDEGIDECQHTTVCNNTFGGYVCECIMSYERTGPFTCAADNEEGSDNGPGLIGGTIGATFVLLAGLIILVVGLLGWKCIITKRCQNITDPGPVYDYIDLPDNRTVAPRLPPRRRLNYTTNPAYNMRSSSIPLQPVTTHSSEGHDCQNTCGQYVAPIDAESYTQESTCTRNTATIVTQQTHHPNESSSVSEPRSPSIQPRREMLPSNHGSFHVKSTNFFT